MIEEVIRTINNAESFFLTSHLNPDGDAVGSLLAFDCFLKEQGRNTTSFLADPLPDNFRFLPNSDNIVNSLKDVRRKSFDVTIVVDSTDWKRTGMGSDPMVDNELDLGTVINIDHHESNDNFGHINIVDPETSAVGEIIYDIIATSKLPLSLDVATCLYTAIMTDTGNFTYSNTTAKSFEISEKLVKIGVRPDKIAEEINENYPISRLELLRMALDTLEFSDDYSIGAITISQDMLKKTNAGPDMIEGFIDYPRYISGVKIAVLFREQKEGGYKVSFRSRDAIDVSRIAEQFNGGGHTNAAGCSIEGKLDEVKPKVFDVIKSNLKEDKR
jgi:phosphoesterase RecJ-like protein